MLHNINENICFLFLGSFYFLFVPLDSQSSVPNYINTYCILVPYTSSSIDESPELTFVNSVPSFQLPFLLGVVNSQNGSKNGMLRVQVDAFQLTESFGLVLDQLDAIQPMSVF